MKDSHYRLLLGAPHRAQFDRHPRNLVHRHTFFEPCLVVGGSGDFDHGGNGYTLKTGDLFLADVGVFHEIKSLKTRDLALYFTSFAVTELGDAPRTNRLEERIIWDFLKGHRILLRSQDHLARYWDCLFALSEARNLPHRAAWLQDLMKQLVLQIMDLLTLKNRDESGADENFQNELDRAIQAIEARLHEPFRIPQIARACGMSERNLRRLFRCRLNRTVTEEIQERRMQRAAALLILPELNVEEVARRVGIENPAQFSRFFKEKMGVPPRTFRADHAGRKHLWIRPGDMPMKTEFFPKSPSAKPKGLK